MWNAFDQVIQESLTNTVNAHVSDSVVANRATVMQMVHVYVAEPTIDCMSDPLKWWAENGIKKLDPMLDNSCAHQQLVCQVSIS